MRRAWVILLGILLAVLLALAGCDLFNQSPIARIAASVLSGASPLTVTFDASESTDPDGVIINYLWDFGDGDTANGETVPHTYITRGPETFTVTLRVTDDRGAQSETTQSIEVLIGSPDAPGGDGLPVARFTSNRLIGLIPFTVTFDASGSTGGDGDIIEFDWDFGDGEQGVGNPITHTYEPENTDEFTVTLFVWNDQGQVDAEQMVVIAIVPANNTGDEEPTAELVASDPNMIHESEERPTIPSLFEVDLDPRGSFADAGHEIEYYLWDFGDGDYQIEESDLEVTHVYELRAETTTFVVTLTVFDDQGLEGIATVNVTLNDPFGPGDIDDDD